MTGKDKAKRILTAFLAGLFAVSQAACGAGDDETASSKPQTSLVTYDENDDSDENSGSGEKAKETLMVYMVGSNLESESGAATDDLQEMADSGYDEDSMNVIVCAGGASHWWNSSVSDGGPNVYKLKDRDLDHVYTMKSDNMGSADTVTEFMDYAYENYPAEHYSIIFWDHGGGAVIGYGADENHNYDMLSVSELREGVSGTSFADEKKLDFIGFDACMMGMAEVADSLSDYADYMIASEETEAGPGWDYSCLKNITDEDAYEGDKAAECVIDSFTNFYDGYGRSAPDYSLSCIDLSKMSGVVEDLETLVSKADASLQNGNYSRIARARDGAKDFGTLGSDSFYDYVDLYSLADSMRMDYPDESKALKSSLEDAVVRNGSNISMAHGLSVYFPYSNKEYASEWVDAYAENGFSDVYTKFIKDFTSTLEGEALTTGWDTLSDVTPEQGSTASEYYVQLTEDQLANYGHSKASIWQADDEDTYICWLNSGDVTLTDDGRLSSNFDGRIFYLTDDSGEYHACCATEIERTDDYVKYSIPVLYNALSPESTAAYIHVKVDSENPDGVICGVYRQIDAESELYPDKNLIEIKDGDELTPFLFARDIVFNDDQTVAPFDQWESSSGAGENFTVSGELKVQLRQNTESQDYICLFRVTDTQGNDYYTNYLTLPYGSVG